MESISKNKFYEIGYAELIEKSDSFQEILATKKLLFWKSSCSEEVPASKSTYSEYWFILEKAPLKQCLWWKKYLSSRSSWLEKVIATKKQLLDGSSCSRQLGFLKKIFLRKRSCFKWLLSFQYNWCCSESKAPSIIGLFHGDCVLKYPERKCVDQIR